MPLNLPPRSIIQQSEENFALVHQELTAVIAGHPQAEHPYTFYEELDDWLGPWGNEGYPIAYGKFYCVAFTTDSDLKKNAVARDWVWKTTVKLQEALRDFIVARFRQAPLISLTEEELRQAAFASHPSAYDKGGLATLVLAAPQLVPVIASIPSVQFHPGSENASASWRQVWDTFKIVGVKVAGGGLAAMAGPAHNGSIRMAFDMDRRRLQSETAVANRLSALKRAIERGDLDHIPWLDQIIVNLNAEGFPNMQFAHVARDVVDAAKRRREVVRARTLRLLEESKEVRRRATDRYPQILQSAPSLRQRAK